MEIVAVLCLLIGIFLVIFSILVFNHYRIHPKEGSTFLFLYLFIFGFIPILGAITNDLGLMWLVLIVYNIITGVISRIYKRHILNKNPELKKKHEMNMEIIKKHPIYKFSKITQYLVLGLGIVLSCFILVVVLFNLKF